jgi:DNA polymerase-3 subunit gamma/tau
VTRTLQNAIEQDRVHHAFLFCGARGTGKTTTARVLAKALNCKEGPTPTPCNECASCLDIASGTSVNVMEIDGASHTGVDDVRELRENVRYLPSQGRRKIYIIDEVHMLSVSAFNALLKTLEEPPPHVTFMFATTEPHKIPATILSRCQRFDLRRVSTTGLSEHLRAIVEKEGLEAHEDALDLVALESGGSVRDSLSLLDQVIAYAGSATLDRDLVARVLGVTDRSTLTDLSAGLIDRDVDAVLRVIDGVFKAGWDLVQLTKSLVAHLRDLCLLASCKKPEEFVHLADEEIGALDEQARRAGRERLFQLFDSAARATDAVSRSEFPKMALEMSLLEMALAEPIVPVGEIAARLERLESRLHKSGPPRPPRGPAGRSSSPAGGAGPRSRTASSRSRGRSGAAARPSEPRGGADQPSASTDARPAAAATAAADSPEPEVAAPESPISEPSPEPRPVPKSSGPADSELAEWGAIVDGVRKRQPALAAALASADLEALSERDGKLHVKLGVANGSFQAERLIGGGVEDVKKNVAEALGRDLHIQIVQKETTERPRPTPRLVEPAGGAPGGGEDEEAPKRPTSQTGAQPEAPRSLHEKKKREKQKRRAQLRDDARNHPAVREIEQVLGGTLRDIRLL